jgi:hypothetical protein
MEFFRTSIKQKVYLVLIQHPLHGRNGMGLIIKREETVAGADGIRPWSSFRRLAYHMDDDHLGPVLIAGAALPAAGGGRSRRGLCVCTKCCFTWFIWNRTARLFCRERRIIHRRFSLFTANLCAAPCFDHQPGCARHAGADCVQLCADGADISDNRRYRRRANGQWMVF